MHRLKLAAVLLFSLSFGAVCAARAADDTDATRAAIERLVDALVAEGVVPAEKRAEIVRRAIEKTAAEPTVPGEIRVQQVPEIVKDEIREQVRQELKEDVVKDIIREARTRRWGVPGAWPEWVDRIAVSGDVRVRGQSDNYASGNGVEFLDYQRINQARNIAIDPVFLNSTEDRDRLRVRMRLALDAQISPGASAGIRIASGSLLDPVSTNQTLGNTGRPFQVILDRAFLQYQTSAQAIIATAGRMPNPFFGTDLVWDPDLNFDGVAIKVAPRHFGEEGVVAYAFEPFVTVGAFPLQEVELSSRDKWLYGGQLGFGWKTAGGSRLRFGAAYYAYDGITGERNAVDSRLTDFTAPQFVQKGNSLFPISNESDPSSTSILFGLASDFREANATLSWELVGVLPVDVVATADYIKNVGFDRDEILTRTGLDLPEETSAHGLALAVGRRKVAERGDWQLFGELRRLEADAVLDAFADSDFHLGGTNAKGWIAGFSYALRDHLLLTTRYLSSNEITADPFFDFDGQPDAFGIDTLQIDLVGSF